MGTEERKGRRCGGRPRRAHSLRISHRRRLRRLATYMLFLVTSGKEEAWRETSRWSTICSVNFMERRFYVSSLVSFAFMLIETDIFLQVLFAFIAFWIWPVNASLAILINVCWVQSIRSFKELSVWFFIDLLFLHDLV